MIMTNEELTILMQKNFTNLDTSSLSPSAAYKVLHFVRAFRKAVQTFSEEREALLHDALGDKYKAALAYEKAPDKNAEGLMTHEEYFTLMTRVQEMLKAFLKEEIEFPAKVIDWSEYFKLKQINKEVFTIEIDNILENVLWKAPDEEEV